MILISTKISLKKNSKPGIVFILPALCYETYILSTNTESFGKSESAFCLVKALQGV